MTSTFATVLRIYAILIMGLIIFRPVLPFFEYALRYDYIIEKLCENRDKPQLKCDGKCHLTKQLASDTGEDEQRRAPSSQQVEIAFNLFCECSPEEQLQPHFHSLRSYTPYLNSCYSFLWSDQAFEPPRSMG